MCTLCTPGVHINSVLYFFAGTPAQASPFATPPETTNALAAIQNVVGRRACAGHSHRMSMSEWMNLSSFKTNCLIYLYHFIVDILSDLNHNMDHRTKRYIRRWVARSATHYAIQNTPRTCVCSFWAAASTRFRPLWSACRDEPTLMALISIFSNALTNLLHSWSKTENPLIFLNRDATVPTKWPHWVSPTVPLTLVSACFVAISVLLVSSSSALDETTYNAYEIAIWKYLLPSWIFKHLLIYTSNIIHTLIQPFIQTQHFRHFRHFGCRTDWSAFQETVDSTLRSWASSASAQRLKGCSSHCRFWRSLTKTTCQSRSHLHPLCRYARLLLPYLVHCSLPICYTRCADICETPPWQTPGMAKRHLDLRSSKPVHVDMHSLRTNWCPYFRNGSNTICHWLPWLKCWCNLDSPGHNLERAFACCHAAVDISTL